MAINKEPLTYRQNVSRQEAYRIIKAVGCPLAIFALALFTISSFANFGTKLICPASGAMWIMGVIVATAMPSMPDIWISKYTISGLISEARMSSPE